MQPSSHGVGAIEEDASVANLDALWPAQVDPGRYRADDDRGRLGPSQQLVVGVEVVTALYFGGFLRHDPKNPHWPDRDRFILSKGHAAPVLYAALAESGYFPHDEIMTLRKIGSPVEGHPNMKRLPPSSTLFRRLRTKSSLRSPAAGSVTPTSVTTTTAFAPSMNCR